MEWMTVADGDGEQLGGGVGLSKTFSYHNYEHKTQRQVVSAGLRSAFN